MTIDLVIQNTVMTYDELSEFVRRERRLREWSQEDLAEKAGLHSKTIFNLEKGIKIRLSSINPILSVFGKKMELDYRIEDIEQNLENTCK